MKQYKLWPYKLVLLTKGCIFYLKVFEMKKNQQPKTKHMKNIKKWKSTQIKRNRILLRAVHKFSLNVIEVLFWGGFTK